MTAQLATVDDRILALVEAPGAIRDGNIIPRSASDKPQADGMQFDCGYLSPHFVTDPGRMEVAFENVYILLHEKEISSKKDLLPLLEQVTKSGKPLLIIAGDVGGEALATLGFESAIEDSAAPIHDRAGRVIGAVIVFHDVSATPAMSRQMTHAAQHDLVTNLPNRLLLNDRISQSISLARRQNRPLAVIFLDLDRFKYINDSLGHATGDKLLQSVSKRLLAGLRGSDTVSRQGGDEFVILLSEIADPEDLAASARKILLLLNAPHSIGGQDLHIGGTIGISVYPGDGEDAETIDLQRFTRPRNGTESLLFRRLRAW